MCSKKKKKCRQRKVQKGNFSYVSEMVKTADTENNEKQILMAQKQNKEWFEQKSKIDGTIQYIISKFFWSGGSCTKSGSLSKNCRGAKL